MDYLQGYPHPCTQKADDARGIRLLGLGERRFRVRNQPGGAKQRA